MRVVKDKIAAWQEIFQRHPFFRRFEGDAPFEDVMSFAPHLTFWVMAFQDVLRLNHDLIRDRVLRNIALHHRNEDEGHDAWFLADLRALGTAEIDIGRLFGTDHIATRAATYGLVSEVYRASDDRVRIALVLTLESAGHVFFGKVARYVERAGHGRRLRYFAPSHLAVEKAHELFVDEPATRLIDSIVLSDELRVECEGMVERVYHAFISMFDALPEVGSASGSFVRIATDRP